MSEYYIKDDEFPLVLKHKSGREYTLSGSTDLALARMLVNMDERLTKLENIIKAQTNEKNSGSGQKNNREKT